MTIPERKHAAKALYKAPLETPALSRCVTLQIPDDDEWLIMLHSALSTMSTWLNYQRSGTTRESQVAQIWRQIISNISECPVPEITIEAVHSPVGKFEAFPTVLDPESGFLFCDGSNYLESEYPDLFAVLIDGNLNHGANWDIDLDLGIPPTTGNSFTLPDLTELRTLAGVPDSDATHLAGDSGGSETVTLTTAQIPAHTHRLWVGDVALPTGTPALTDVGRVTAGGGYTSASHVTQSQGSGEAHPNMPPYLNVFWHIRAVAPPDVILEDLKQYFVQDVYAEDCVLFKVKQDETFHVLTITDCIEGYEPDEPEKDVDEGNQPETLEDNDCIWGGVDAAVNWLVEKTDDFIDIVEAATDILEDLTNAFPATWVTAKFVGGLIGAVNAVVIVAARLELATTSFVDGAKCDLFCRIVANGGLLTPAIFTAWLNWLEPISVTPSSAGGLAIHLTTYFNGYNAVFRRFTLYANNACSDDWMTICDECSGACADTALALDWDAVGETPMGWESPSTVPPNHTHASEYRQLTRTANTRWDASGSDWRSGCIVYTFPEPTNVDRLGIRAFFDTTNQKILRVSVLQSGVWTGKGSINPTAPSNVMVQETFEFDEVCVLAVRFEIWGVGGRISDISINDNLPSL